MSETGQRQRSSLEVTKWNPGRAVQEIWRTRCAIPPQESLVLGLNSWRISVVMRETIDTGSVFQSDRLKLSLR